MKIETCSVFPVICLCVISLITPCSFAADQDEGLSDSQAEAREILMDMGKFLSQTQRFSVNIRNGYDVVQESGQKIEFNDKRKVIVSRPDHLRIDVEKSNGNRNLSLIDGKNITVFSITENVYAQAPSPGDLDAAIEYLLKDLHMRLPLAMLLITQLPAELEHRVKNIDYVEETNIFGVPAHHLAGRTETVDFQIWIKNDCNPLPLRIVLTYKNADGQPQFWAQFSDWNLSPEITDSLFTFTPPEGAKKINFLARLNEMGIKAKEPTAPTEEQSAGEQP